MARMFVNGEAVYVPELKYDLIKGLEHMGVYRIAGEPLRQARLDELDEEYRHVLRACIVRRQRRQRTADKRHTQVNTQRPRRPVQMVLVPAR